MKEKTVPNKVRRMADGSEYDSPDCPIMYKVIRRNEDGTWVVLTED